MTENFQKKTGKPACKETILSTVSTILDKNGILEFHFQMSRGFFFRFSLENLKSYSCIRTLRQKFSAGMSFNIFGGKIYSNFF